MDKFVLIVKNIPCFFVAFVLIINLIIYKSLIQTDENWESICHNFMKDGYVDANGWIPSNCELHNYTDEDARNCFIKKGEIKNNFILLFGDSRTRQTYDVFVSKFANGTVVSKKNVKLQYFNDKYSIAVEFTVAPIFDNNIKGKLKYYLNPKNADKVPNILTAAVGIHRLHYTKDQDRAIQMYRKTITETSLILKKLTKLTRVIYILIEFIIEGVNKDPHVKNKSIMRCNDIAREVFNGSDVMLMESSWKFAKSRVNNYLPDGNHPGFDVREHKAQMLLNLYCNDVMRPPSATCCVNPARTNFGLSKIYFLIILINCAVVGMTFIITNRNLKNVNNLGVRISIDTNSLLKQTLKNLIKFSLIIGYFILAERTSIFEKTDKIFSFETFTGPLIILFIFGIYLNKKTKNNEVMNRDITDELKGWMQLVILFYHISGASKILPIYIHVRVMVSTYVFMTGFGHFIYYWRGGYMGIKRYLQVMFRMNFFTVVLCIMMNNSYQHYYFVPLISFWFTVGYILLALPPKRNEGLCGLSDEIIILFKIIILILIIVVFDHVKNFYFPEYSGQSIIDKTKGTFYLNIREWCFRWELDRFSLLYGLLFGFGFVKISENMIKSPSKSQLNNSVVIEDGYKHDKDDRISTKLKILIIIFSSVLLFTLFEYISFKSNPKVIYNIIHPYITWMPILSYIILRNIFESIRTKVSYLMEWFGQISLELFLCQFHIWLSEDTTKALQLIPNYPIVNIIIAFIILIIISNEINEITGFCAKLIFSRMNKSPKKLLNSGS